MGQQVPISLVHKHGLALPAPCLLYGYGAYEHSIDPTFSHHRLSLLDRGMVYAVAHVRGGGEMGRAWYEDGRMEHKTNTFSDFVASARHLVAQGIARPDALAGRGGSAGGLLIGAVANAAPELFAALVAQVPFVDCVTTMLDDELPLTVGEWEEWGNPLADEAAFARMLSYSPYDNVAGTQPRRFAAHLPEPAGHRRPQRPSSQLLGAGEVGGQNSRPLTLDQGPPAHRNGRRPWGALRALRRLEGGGARFRLPPRRTGNAPRALDRRRKANDTRLRDSSLDQPARRRTRRHEAQGERGLKARRAGTTALPLTEATSTVGAPMMRVTGPVAAKECALTGLQRAGEQGGARGGAGGIDPAGPRSGGEGQGEGGWPTRRRSPCGRARLGQRHRRHAGRSWWCGQTSRSCPFDEPVAPVTPPCRPGVAVPAGCHAVRPRHQEHDDQDETRRHRHGRRRQSAGTMVDGDHRLVPTDRPRAGACGTVGGLDGIVEGQRDVRDRPPVVAAPAARPRAQRRSAGPSSEPPSRTALSGMRPRLRDVAGLRFPARTRLGGR